MLYEVITRFKLPPGRHPPFRARCAGTGPGTPHKERHPGWKRPENPQTGGLTMQSLIHRLSIQTQKETELINITVITSYSIHYTKLYDWYN